MEVFNEYIEYMRSMETQGLEELHAEVWLPKRKTLKKWINKIKN